jgi:hypothetical protein
MGRPLDASKAHVLGVYDGSRLVGEVHTRVGESFFMGKQLSGSSSKAQQQQQAQQPQQQLKAKVQQQLQWHLSLLKQQAQQAQQ